MCSSFPSQGVTDGTTSSDPALGQLGSNASPPGCCGIHLSEWRGLHKSPGTRFPFFSALCWTSQMCPGCEQGGVRARLWLIGQGPWCSAWQFPDPPLVGATQASLRYLSHFLVLTLEPWRVGGGTEANFSWGYFSKAIKPHLERKAVGVSPTIHKSRGKERVTCPLPDS